MLRRSHGVRRPPREIDGGRRGATGKLKGVAKLFEGRHLDREATIQIVALYVRW